MADCDLDPIDGTVCHNAGLGYGPAAGTPMSTSNASDGDNPRRECDAVAKMAPIWEMIDDLMGGTGAMRLAGVKHLPQFPFEGTDAYAIRRSTAVLFPAYPRTVSVLIGKPFSKPITVGEKVPAQIREWLKDVDREGRDLTAFTTAVGLDALGYGISGILVDAPPSGGARTVKDERDRGIRPYWVHVKHDAILGWQTERIDGSSRLTQLRILETAEVPVGRFGVKQVEQVRVLYRGSWETYRKQDDDNGKSTWRVHESGTTSIPEIPFVPIYGARRDYMVGWPPMLDLAYLNIQHWQSSSDQQTILSTARIPILFTKGMEKTEKLAVGAGAMTQAKNPDADMKFVEHTGSAIEAGRTSILDLEDQMRQVGAELLVIKPGNTTEVQTRSDNEPAMCDLQRIMGSLQDGLNLAIHFTALFVGEKDGGHVSIYSDFGVATLAEASAQLLATMQTDGALSHATLLNELKRRGVLSADVDVTAEIAAAAQEREAAQAEAAEREQAMLDRAMVSQADREMAQGDEPQADDDEDQ